MAPEQQISTKKNPVLLAWLFALITGIITLRTNDYTIDPGLDAPFRWALNHFIATNTSVFGWIQYTVGPLCLLKWPAPVANNILISTLFNLAIAAWFSFSFIRAWSRRWEGSEWQPFGLSVVFLLIVNLEIALLGCIAINCIDFLLHDRKLSKLFPAILITIIAIYIKTSLFVWMSCAWLPVFVLLLTTRHYKLLGKILLLLVSLYILAGFILTGGWGGLVAYTFNNVLFASGYSDMLSLYPQNNWTYIGTMWIALLAAGISSGKSQARTLFIASMPLLFTMWKYSMGREDFYHGLMLPYFLLLLLMLRLLVNGKHLATGVVLMLVSISAYASNMQNMYAYREQYFWFPRFINFSERVLHFQSFHDRALMESTNSCAPNKLPESTVQSIGAATIDVFPWDLSIAWINKLNYSPRPSLQSIGLSAGTDGADATQLSSAKAPVYIVWHATAGEKCGLEGLDDQYLPNTCPSTVQALLANYQPWHTEGNITIWKKNSTTKAIKVQTQQPTKIPLGSWQNVPAHDSNTFLFLSASLQSTLRYRIRQFLYKGTQTFIEYQTIDGRVLRFRFSGKYQPGLFVDPLVMDNQGTTLHITRYRISADKPADFAPEIDAHFSTVVR